MCSAVLLVVSGKPFLELSHFIQLVYIFYLVSLNCCCVWIPLFTWCYWVTTYSTLEGPDSSPYLPPKCYADFFPTVRELDGCQVRDKHCGLPVSIGHDPVTLLFIGWKRESLPHWMTLAPWFRTMPSRDSSHRWWCSFATWSSPWGGVTWRVTHSLLWGRHLGLGWGGESPSLGHQGWARSPAPPALMCGPH